MALCGNTVEPRLKDHPIGHKIYGFSRQVVFGDRIICIKCTTFPKPGCPLRQVISHGSGVSGHIPLYTV